MRNITNILSDTLHEMEWNDQVRETYNLHPDNNRCIVVRIEMIQDPTRYIVFEILNETIPVVCLLESKNIHRQTYTRFLDALVINL